MIKRPVVIGDINILRAPRPRVNVLYPSGPRGVCDCAEKEVYMTGTTVRRESVETFVSEEKREERGEASCAIKSTRGIVDRFHGRS